MSDLFYTLGSSHCHLKQWQESSLIWHVLADESVDVLQCRVGLEAQKLDRQPSFCRTWALEVCHLKER